MHDNFRTFSVGKHREYKRGARNNRIPLHRDEDFYDDLTVVRRKGYHGGPSFSFRFIGGWLRAQVGRRWDDVFSEIAEEYDARSVKGWQIRRYVTRWRGIALHCFIDDDGEIRNYEGYRGDPGRGDYFPKARGLFVHPTTGLLCYREVKNPSGFRPQPIEITNIKLDDGTWYEYIECSAERGPYYKFHAWFHCSEEVEETRYFEPVRTQDMEWYARYYANKTLEEILQSKGNQLWDRKGEMVWGQYRTRTKRTLTKRFCTDEQRQWIAHRLFVVGATVPNAA